MSLPSSSPSGGFAARLRFGSEWRREALRTNLWLVPTIEVVAAVALFVAHVRDRSGGLRRRRCTLPSWVISGTADAARQILTAIAAAVITVVGARLLDHDRDADARVDAVRAADAAQLHPRPGHAGHARHVRRDVRLRGPGARLDRPGRARRLRPAPVDHRDARAGRRRPRRAHLLHPPHREVDPAAGGHREHRPRPVARDRRRERRAAPSRGDTCRGRPVGVRAAAAHGRVAAASCRRPRSGYLQFVRHDTLVRHRGAHRRGDPPAAPPGALRRGGPSAGDGLAAPAPPRGRRGRSSGAHVTGPHRTLTQDLVVRRRPARRDRDPRAVAGGQRHLHRAHLHRLARRRPVQDRGSTGTRSRVHRDAPRQRARHHRSRSATTAWSSAPSTRSARPAGACRR